jgi:hypothetical protein
MRDVLVAQEFRSTMMGSEEEAKDFNGNHGVDHTPF